MSVLDRAALEQSPLADLHAIASELSLDGYRRLRKGELIEAILERQAGGGGEARGPDAGGGEADAGGGEADAGGGEADAGGGEAASGRRRRGRRGGRGRGQRTAEEGSAPRADGVEEIEAPLGPAEEPAAAEDQAAVEGVVELLPNGSAFLRVSPPDASEDDIYISAAQVKRCELVSGDRIAGPRRPPRRSERFASLVRVDTINGRPAEELADSARFDDLPAGFPTQRLSLDSDDLTLTAISELAPIGRGSRVTITGHAQAGKTEALRRLAAALAGQQELQVQLALVGVRPEEVSEWRAGPVVPAVALNLAASPEALGQAVESVVEQARRIAGRGGHQIVLIDTLELVPPQVARRALASARRLLDGGSVTVIATAPEPVGGETTVIALDAALARAGQFPALDPAATWTLRRELLGG
jgi:transcription termination factor Rho